MYVPAPQMLTVAHPVGATATDDNGCPICASCWSGYLMAFVIGGLVSAVVVLGAQPAVRLHKEYSSR